ncbi:hypothetical protein Dimus_027278 [Dionaea muscipula]
MWVSKGGGGKKVQGNGTVAVAIDKDKSSQYALKWAIDHLLAKGNPVILIHVINKSSGSAAPTDGNVSALPLEKRLDKQTQDLFLTYRCLCTRKDIPCLDIILEESNVVRALLDYVTFNVIENLVLGASRGGFIRRFKYTDVPTSISRAAPDFCSIYVISKGKISSVRNASRSAPFSSPLANQLQSLVKVKTSTDSTPRHSLSMKVDKTPIKPRRSSEEKESVRPRRFIEKPFGDFSELDSDISFVSSERTSSVDLLSPVHYDIMDGSRFSPRLSVCSEQGFGSRLGAKFNDFNALSDFSFVSHESGRTSCSSLMTEDMEAEMRRLKLELKQTMDLYSTACKEAIGAKQKALELQRWRFEEEKRSEAVRIAEEAAAMQAEGDMANSRGTFDAEDAARRIAMLEAEKRLSAEMKSLKEESMMMESANSVARYRKYTIEEIEAATDFFAGSRKIGEGGYGPVFKCNLDHTQVAVKVLRPDAAQGRTQFQQEVEVLSCIRHPNLVLLLGACPEYGCLVYEYMARGSLEDCLRHRGNTQPLSWQLRFRIAAEVATGLHFLHQTKPEPLVHRDLKPANILLDQNFVSKISDVGLARLVPPTVADSVTQYRMTSTAGTFCYIDPEYQQTGMLGVKSDVYSLGILLLQLITAKPPMGLAHHVALAIENGTFADALDPVVPNWPVEEALSLAKLAVQCAELRRKDRPDLGKVVLPELARLRELADESMAQFMFYGGAVAPPSSYSCSSQEVFSDPALGNSTAMSSKGPSATSTPRAGHSEPTVE